MHSAIFTPRTLPSPDAVFLGRLDGFLALTALMSNARVQARSSQMRLPHELRPHLRNAGGGVQRVSPALGAARPCSSQGATRRDWPEALNQNQSPELFAARRQAARHRQIHTALFYSPVGRSS